MDANKRAYFSMIRKLMVVMEKAGRTTLEISFYEEPNALTLKEFTNEVGPGYEYTIIHRGIVRIRKK